MNELQRIVEDMQTVFADSAYPKEFLAAYDQMECLASHKGRETFLVRRCCRRRSGRWCILHMRKDFPS